MPRLRHTQARVAVASVSASTDAGQEDALLDVGSSSSMHDWSRYEFDFSSATDDDTVPGGRERKCVVQLEAVLGALATTDPLFQW